MHSDEKIQEKSARYSATVTSNKLLLEIDDNVTYKGEIESTPYFDLNELKAIFQNGKVEVLCKTTSKMSIKLLGFLKVQLQSEENRQLQQLKAKIQQLEAKLKASGQWEQEDLDSKANFDLNYSYVIYVSNTSLTHSSITVGITGILINHAGSFYTVANTNRRTCTAGWTVTKIIKKKLI